MGSKNDPSDVLAVTWHELLFSESANEITYNSPLLEDTSMRRSAQESLSSFYRAQREKKYSKVSPARLRSFLVELANCVDASRLARKYQEFVWPELPEPVSRWLEHVRGLDAQEQMSRPKRTPVGFPMVETPSLDAKPELGSYLLPLRDELRKIWREEDERERNWLIYRLSVLNQGMLKVLDPELIWLKVRDPITGAQAPPFVPFEQAIFYLQRNSDKAKVCRNSACTIEPFFFSDRNSFCSEVCSEQSRKAAKRRAWHKNKKKWRASA